MKYLIILLVISVNGFGQNIYRTSKVSIHSDSFYRPVAKLTIPAKSTLTAVPEDGMIESWGGNIYVTWKGKRYCLDSILSETLVEADKGITVTCEGTTSNPYVIVEGDTLPVININDYYSPYEDSATIEANTRAFNAAWESAKNNDTIINPYPDIAWQSHTHKWVELHQDTAQVYSREALDEPWLIPYLYNRGMRSFGDDIWQFDIPLICLICNEEKKKIIHYRRDYTRRGTE